MKSIILFLVAVCLNFSVFESNAVSASSTTVPALNYSGLLETEPSIRQSCQFSISLVKAGELDTDPSFMIAYKVYHSPLLYKVPERDIAPTVLSPYYFDSDAPSGRRFYSIVEDQSNSSLRMAAITLKDSALLNGTSADPNALSELKRLQQIQTSMLLEFKSGVSYEDFLFAAKAVLSGSQQDSELALLNTLEVVDINHWVKNGYESTVCKFTKFYAVENIKFDIELSAVVER